MICWIVYYHITLRFLVKLTDTFYGLMFIKLYYISQVWCPTPQEELFLDILVVFVKYKF